MFSKKIYPDNVLLIEYLDFLRTYQNLFEATIVIRRNYVMPFLLRRGISHSTHLRLLTAKSIHDHIIETAPSLHRASKKHLTSSIRSFLRFAYIKNYISCNLVEVVPVITTWKLERLPESISWENIQKLLTMPDIQTPAGRRDLAVMMLCIHYGVRIGQVTALKLSDIHWEEGFICFTGCKWSNSLRLPLLEDVADALYKEGQKKSALRGSVFNLARGTTTAQ
ncbi:MAG: integrase/recombinase XerD [Parasphingorhabdus sp.]|jgi:integrase/recombinase XerD